jgi:hypothetical protein
MAGSYRASIGHNPKILVKKQNIGISGADIAFSQGSVSPPGESATRVFEEPFFNEVLNFPGIYTGYSLLRPRITHLCYPDTIPPGLANFTISAQSDVYVWTISSISKANWVLQTGVTASGSYGNTYKLYKRTAHPSGSVTTWGANGLDTTNGDIVNLPPLFMVPSGITITNTPTPYCWQKIGGGNPLADKIATYVDARYWTDVGINAPGTDANGATVQSYANLTALNAAIAAATPGTYLKYTNTTPITGTVTCGTSGTWAKSIRVYVSNPNAISLQGAGRVVITGDHVEVIGWSSSGSTLAGSKTTGSNFYTQAGADWCAFHHCSVIDKNAATLTNGSASASFTLLGKMTGVINCFTHAKLQGSVTGHDGIWTSGNTGTQAVSIPCPIVRRTWMKGDIANVPSGVDSQTPLQFGEKNGFDTWLPELGAGVTYGNHWTSALIYRCLVQETTAGVEMTTNKHSGNTFVQNRLRRAGGAWGNRNGYYHGFIGEWIDAGGQSFNTVGRRGGYRCSSKEAYYLNCYIDGLDNTGSAIADCGAWKFGAGNKVGSQTTNPAYIEAADCLIAHCTVRNIDHTVFEYNEAGSGAASQYVYQNDRVWIINSVVDAASQNMVATDSTVPGGGIIAASNIMQNNVMNYSAAGTPGNMTVPAKTIPQWVAGTDNLYRPTVGGNMAAAKTLTVKFPDAGGAARTTYVGAYEPGSGNVFPVGITVGANGNPTVGPTSTLMAGV